MRARHLTLRRLTLMGTLLLAPLLGACGTEGGDPPPPAGGPPAPTFAMIDVTQGPQGGGTPLTLTGTGFDQGVDGITVGGIAANLVMQVDETTATCTTPPGAPGAADVAIDVNGTVLTLPGAFTYIPAPAPMQVVPDTGWEAGGPEVRILGAGFMDNGAGAPTVTIGGTVCASPTVVSDTEITCTLPVGAAMMPAVDVQVANSNGSGTLTGGFDYRPHPPTYDSSDNRADSGTAGSSASDAPQVCCNASNVYVVWQDARGSDIYFNRSTDGGATWGTDTSISGSSATSGASTAPQICCVGDTIYVVFVDTRAGKHIYFQKSTNGGATWLSDAVRLDNGSEGTEPTLCCEGDNVYVAWRDTRGGLEPTDIYCARSLDGGGTWLQMRVDTDTIGTFHSMEPRLCCSGQYVYVMWKDRRDGGTTLYANYSTDRGATWGVSDKRVDVGSNNNPLDPRICCSGQKVYVTWYDGRSGILNDVFFNRSTDNGVSWGGTATRLNTNTLGFSSKSYVRLCCDGDNIYCVWADNRDGNADIHFNRSTDGGANWLATDKRLDTDMAGAAISIDIQICCEGDTVGVIWCDRRNGNAWDCYVNTSTDAGSSWQANDSRTDTDAGAAADSILPQICCDGARIYVVWQDYRSGQPDIITNYSLP